MSNFNAKAPKGKFKKWGIRWNEALGKSECPYAYRWVFSTPWFAIRIHNFLRSDDKRFYHDHAWDFWTFILWGFYWDVSPYMNRFDTELGQKRIRRKWLHLYHVKAEHAHYVDVPKGGCWTLVLSMKPRRKWGFHVGERFFRPLRYFHKYGHPPCDEQ